MARGLLSHCGAWAPEHAGSVVAALGFSCPAACGSLVPGPGIEPTSPALEGRFLTTGPRGNSPMSCFLGIYKLILKFYVQRQKVLYSQHNTEEQSWSTHPT